MKRVMYVIVGLLIAVAFSAPYILFRNQIREMEIVGYAGLFFACALSNVSILIPSSATIIVLAASMTLNPWFSILFGGLGTALGEQSSYICGRVGASGFDASLHWNQRILDAMQKHSFLTVFLFAFVPLPVFDIAGIMAGAMRMNWGKYTAAAALGKTLKFLMAFAVIFFIAPQMLKVLPGPWGAIYEQVLEQLGFYQ